MKVRFTNQRCQALTFIEVLAILSGLFIMMVVMLLPWLNSAKQLAQRKNCASNLKQVGLAALIWEGDNNNLYPMQVSITNGGGKELIAMNNVAGFFNVISNELSTDRILRCPTDAEVLDPINDCDSCFGPLDNNNISYFVGLDANEKHPQRLMFGDDNFEINGIPVPSGVAQIPANTLIAWQSGRHDKVERVPVLGIPLHHNYCGNICFADGSVQDFSTLGLQQALQQTGLATNRLAIP